MLTSKARRRLAQKTSALGLASTLLFVAGSTFFHSTAAAQSNMTSTCTAETTTDATLKVPISTSTGGDKGPKTATFNCTTGTLTNQPIQVKLSTTASTVAPGGSFDVTLEIPQLTLATTPTTASTLNVGWTPTVSPSTAETGTKPGGAITAQSTTVPAKSVVFKITAAATGTMVEIKPGSLSFTIGTGNGTGTDIIQYDCEASGDPNYPGAIDIKVVLTPPTTATANADASIKWESTVQTTGDPLTVPTGGFTTGTKAFGTIAATGAGVPASATGEGTISSTTAGSPFTIQTITVKIKPTTTGEVTLTPGNLVFDTSATGTKLKCVPPATGLKTYKFTVTAGNGTTPTPTPTPTPTTTTPKPTKTTTKFVTETPKNNNGKVTKTPKAGADTGGGGDMGPDGRMFILTGSLLILAAGAGGLMVRRRGLNRG
ncbi:hypothetical protein AB0K48_26150 [Nonomuraea sp. NPDC055795]